MSMAPGIYAIAIAVALTACAQNASPPPTTRRTDDSGMPTHDSGTPPGTDSGPVTVDAGGDPIDGGPRCGDGTCNAGETCTSCAGDCGACPPRCGDGTCNAGETCTSCVGDCGACAPVCGVVSCATGVPGCRVGVHRSTDPGTGEHFYTTSLAEAGCCSFTLEFANYFYIYTGPQPGLVAFHRCYLSSGKHFYTVAVACEGSPGAIDEGTMGYVATDATCGATPLYRFSSPTAGHFYTTDAGERDAAVASAGFVSEGIAAWVWGAP